MLVFLLSAAMAGEIHAGIPTRGVVGMGEPSFQTVESGWSSRVPGGLVRVYVGSSEQAARSWYEGHLGGRSAAPRPIPNFGDMAHGNGVDLMGFRDGNVAVWIETMPISTRNPETLTNARELAENLLGAIVEDGPRPQRPRLVPTTDGVWRLEAPGATHLSFEGGRLIPGEGALFDIPPRSASAWGPLGRTTTANFGTEP
ncbi:MAG: hypothetical protein QGG40_11095 [Myxococcota bacterium]|nr:hypothetical protein [Myxococcota bacterium]